MSKASRNLWNEEISKLACNLRKVVFFICYELNGGYAELCIVSSCRLLCNFQISVRFERISSPGRRWHLFRKLLDLEKSSWKTNLKCIVCLSELINLHTTLEAGGRGRFWRNLIVALWSLNN